MSRSLGSGTATIDIDADIASSDNLLFKADEGISIDADVSTIGSHTITITADLDANGTGDLDIAYDSASATITSDTGGITLQGDNVYLGNIAGYVGVVRSTGNGDIKITANPNNDTSGDFIIANTGSEVIRGDGVTPYYVDKDFKTVSDKGISDLLFEIAKEMGLNVHRGKAWTTDALLRETREIVEAKRKEGARAVDMVSSTLLTICQTYKIKAGSILAVSDNVITGEMGFMNPLYYMAESNLIKIALEAVKKMEAKL